MNDSNPLELTQDYEGNLIPKDQGNHVSPASSSEPAFKSDSDSSVHGRFLPGARIAERYRIVSLAGRGGMGEVYRTDDLKLGHPVALKFLPRDVKEGSRSFQHFLSEVRLSRQIAHPNVCRVYDIAEVDGQQFLSMEYIDGEDLKGLLRRIGRLPKDKGIQIAQQLCAGLAAAHEKGVLHRDLKPANVMIDARGQARITDFGLARLAEGEAGAGEIVGTPAYMAPEQLVRGETTIQSDLYSLGLILYELFTGEQVHKGKTFQDIQRSHEESFLTNPSELVPDLDPAVERAILRCLQQDPGQRPKSARAVAAALPGGDPLAAALAAGETPSPEMVAAAGGQGAIDKRLGLFCLAGVAVGLALVCWIAQRTYLVNQLGLNRHPESLADGARLMIERFGYTYAPAMQAHGFRNENKDALRFWYRQSPASMSADRFSSDQFGEESFARINPENPHWIVHGELGVELDPAGRLIQFRAIPLPEPSDLNFQATPHWQEWYPKEFTGIDLSSLESIEERGPPPPDAFDQLQVWKGTQPGMGGDIYVQAAAWAGKPVYFRIFSRSTFEGRTPSMAIGRLYQPQKNSAARQRGESIFVALAFLVWSGAVVLAWRNVRLGRGDRKGAFRVAFFLFSTGMLSWLFLASHNAANEMEILRIGMAQILGKVAFFWLCYLTLEPHIRRLWPQVLISWSRLVNGQWHDPIVGQNVLLGVLAGVLTAAINQFQVLAPTWFGLTPLTFTSSHSMALDGPFALAGLLLRQIIDATSKTLFTLMILFLLRAVLRRRILVSCAYIGVMTIAVGLRFENPLIGWILVAIVLSIILWVYLRLGFLAGIVTWLTFDALQIVPLTTNFSAWYAGNGLAVVGLFFALAAFGFYTSQAGQPIFQWDPGKPAA